MDQISPPQAEIAAAPPIPVIDVRGTGEPALALLDAAPERIAAITACALDHYGTAFIHFADRMSRHWLARNPTPYGPEIGRVAARLGRPGPWFLNASLEWSCTCAIDAAAPDGMRLLRILDWPLEGLGRNLVIARQSGPAGEFLNITWPGFSGVVTALAPGRFAAALNQAPMQRYGLARMGDWAINRCRVWRSRDIPPLHLLRRVMEDCVDFAAARRALCETPLAIPAIFTLAGVKENEGCVIERTGHHVFVHDAPICISNHWIADELRDRGRPRGEHTHLRRALMESVHAAAGEDFDWLVEPVLNDNTRLASSLNAATGRLIAQGWESGAPATTVLSLDG